MSVKVVVREEAKEDLRNLPSNAVKLEALKYLLRLEKKPELGLELENLPGVGDLSDCRKIFINERRHRIVYRVLTEKGTTTVDIIAVGPRALLKVYVEAVKRLNS